MSSLFSRIHFVGLLSLGLALLLPAAAAAITAGQIDTFDADAGNWAEGGVSPNPPFRVASGGPDGGPYLRNVSSGTGRGGSRMIMFNQNQWAGDYTDAGVDRIRLQAANFGTNDLNLRVAVLGANSSWWVSSTPVLVSTGGVWQQVTFQLNDAQMTQASGSGTLADALGNVTILRILSNAGAADFRGEIISGILGVDDVAAIDSTIPVVTSSWGAVKAVYDAR